MKSTIKLFTTESLVDASAHFLKKLGINYTSIVGDVPFDEYFKRNDFNYNYVKNAVERLEHIWNIGYVDDSTFNCDSVQEDADSLSIFACEIKPDVEFSHKMAIDLTRAFNRMSSKNVNGVFDMPVIVLMRQGDKLSISTCERTERADGKGDKMGKVTILRDIDCNILHAGHRQILERIADEVKKAQSYEDLYKKWLKSFSIDVLSDAFFEGYKAIYEDIVALATGKRMKKEGSSWKEDNDKQIPEEEKERYGKKIMAEFTEKFGIDHAEKAVRDYIKKLMGRLVFIQFLQKKGWMGVPENQDWKGGDPEFLQNLFKNSSYKDTFVNDVLKPLFLHINKPHNGDDFVKDIRVNQGKRFKVPYLNGGLFEPDEYDATTFVIPSKFFWNESEDQNEVDRHPGILQFFSNYNFTIAENAPDDVEVAVDPEMLGRIFENLLEDNKEKGAFYTRKEIVRYMCRESLIAYLQTDIEDENTKTAYRNFVMSHDIEQLPREDIAHVERLLKDVKVCDPAIGSGAFPMGMLKELFECRRAIEKKSDKRDAVEIKKDIIQNSIYGVDIEKGAVDIARLRFWLALIVDEQTPHALPNMDFKIMQGNSLLEQYQGVDLSDLFYRKTKREEKYGVRLSFFDNAADLTKQQFSIMMNQYYRTEDHEKKAELREKIKANVQQQLDELQYDVDMSEISDISATSQFFLWHTWFGEVFAKGGFDIVIGNPPYFVYEGSNKGEIVTLKKIKDFKIAMGGKLNAYKLFLAHALKCLLKKSGVNCFIFQNSFMADLQAANLREYTLSNCQILSIDSFPERDSKKKRVFESVKMSVCIVVIRNIKGDKPFIVNIWNDRDKTSGTNTSFSKLEIDAIDKKGHTIPRISEELKPIIIKMLKHKQINIKCNEGELNVTTHRRYFSSDKSLPVIMKGAGIQRYYHTFNMSQGSIEYLMEDEYLKDFGTLDKAQHHYSQRIVMQGMTGANDKIRLVMTIVPEGMYLGHSCKYIMPIDELPLECILAIMNSKVANVFFRCFSTNSNVNGYEVENIPIPKIPIEIQTDLTKKVLHILSAKQDDIYLNTTVEEREIDRLVYKLYGLTEDEIAIVENSYKS